MTKRLRYFSLFISIVVAVVVFLSACGSNPTDSPQEQLQGKLLIWHPFEGEIAKIFTGFINEFEQLNPKVQIVSEYLPLEKLSRDFIKQGEYGFGPNILIDLRQNITELVQTGHIRAISDKNTNLFTDFSTNSTQVRYQDEIYGWPLSYQLRVLCYNQAKLKSSETELGLNQPPSTLQGLIDRAKKGYSVGMVSSFEDTFWGSGVFGAKFFDSSGLIENQLEGWAKWLEWLKSANTEPNFILVRNRDILHRAFAQGKLTYYICNSNEIVDLKNTLKDDLRATILPSDPDYPATPILYEIVMVFSRHSSSIQNNLALKFANFITNPEQQLKGVVQSQSFIPSNPRVKINRQLLPIEGVLQQQAKTAVIIPLEHTDRFFTLMKQGDIIYQKALAGDISSEEAVAKLREIIQIDSPTHQEEQF